MFDLRIEELDGIKYAIESIGEAIQDVVGAMGHMAAGLSDGPTGIKYAIESIGEDLTFHSKLTRFQTHADRMVLNRNCGPRCTTSMPCTVRSF